MVVLVMVLLVAVLFTQLWTWRLLRSVDRRVPLVPPRIRLLPPEEQP